MGRGEGVSQCQVVDPVCALLQRSSLGSFVGRSTPNCLTALSLGAVDFAVEFIGKLLLEVV